MRPIIIGLLAILLAGIALAQTTENDGETETAPEPPAIPALPLRSYDSGWTRWTNRDSGEPILDSEDTTLFPFNWIESPAAIDIDDLHDADFLDALLEQHDFAYDADATDGQCDTEKLANYGSSDMFCVPGADAMPFGHIFLALYDAETGELAALTTTIDNNAGGAAVISQRKLQPQAAATPTGDSCGNYAAGQWIAAADFDNSANLPVHGETDSATDYQCVVAADGGAYFQAYTLVNGGGGSTNGVGSGNRGIGGGGYEDWTPTDPTQEPCTDPLGCDDGNTVE